MTDLQRWIMIASLASATILTRFIPFLLFPEHKELPTWLIKLGDRLPYASLGMLVVYALKDIKLTQTPFGASEIISLMCITLIHKAFKNTLVSIFSGLVIYLVCVNLLFN